MCLVGVYTSSFRVLLFVFLENNTGRIGLPTYPVTAFACLTQNNSYLLLCRAHHRSHSTSHSEVTTFHLFPICRALSFSLCFDEKILEEKFFSISENLFTISPITVLSRGMKENGMYPLGVEVIEFDGVRHWHNNRFYLSPVIPIIPLSHLCHFSFRPLYSPYLIYLPRVISDLSCFVYAKEQRGRMARKIFLNLISEKLFTAFPITVLSRGVREGYVSLLDWMIPLRIGLKF